MIYNFIKRKISSLESLAKNYFCRKKINYVVESAKWSIQDVGYQITSRIPKSRIVKSTRFLKNSIIHFGSINTVKIKNNNPVLPNKCNNIIISWFHVSPEDPHINYIQNIDMKIDLWHTSSSITKNILINFGASDEKIKIIPLGVDIQNFHPPTVKEKEDSCKKFNIPVGKIVIGSFQKDGNGWGEGLEPKLIKGPDIFLEVIKNLKEEFEIHCLLSGPARGYVKKGLDEMGVPYTHRYYDNPWEVSQCYRACDLYLITSRIEGGPKSMLESLASGVPLVTTKVGMVPDILKDGKNAFIVEPGDVSELSKKARQLLKNPALAERHIAEGLQLSQQYNWDKIAERYYLELYSVL